VLNVKQSVALKNKSLIIARNGTGNCINSCYSLDSGQYMAKAVT